MKEDNSREYKILIVDDVPQNIQVLANILKDAGYQIGFAQDGKTALAHADTTSFDLILLDIMMPDMDGYEVCERLKNDKKKRDIPVIFITAKDDISGKTRGFELGAVDYITKPFDVQEVLARVKTHLTIRNYSTRLENLVKERTEQLIHADRLATLGMFSAAIAHEIKNPLSYIMGNMYFIRFFCKLSKPLLEKHLDEYPDLNIQEDIQNIEKKIDDIYYGIQCISRLVASLSCYSREKEEQKKRTLLIEVINDAINIVGHKLRLTDTEIDVSVPSDLAIFCNAQKISQVFINLIDNACDMLKDNENGRITIRASTSDDKIDIEVADNGPGIADGIRDRIFEPFFTSKEKYEGTGLGLFIVNNIIKEHDGEIRLAPYNGKGAEFHIILPKA